MTDFFLIVNRILCHYARGSAFVELNHWQGLPCYDCGGIVGDEDRYVCERCGESVCTDCSRCCRHCDNITCSECTSDCPVCDEPACNSCLTACRACGVLVCSECLEDTTCIKCTEDNDEEPEEDPKSTVEQVAVPARSEQSLRTPVQSDRLGEAPLSA